MPATPAEPNHFQPQPGWLTMVQVPVESPDDVVFQTREFEKKKNTLPVASRPFGAGTMIVENPVPFTSL